MYNGRIVGLSVMAALWLCVVVLLAVGVVPFTKAIFDTMFLFGTAIGGSYSYIRVSGQRVLPTNRKRK